MALAAALLASLAVIAGAPVLGQARAALQATLPGEYRFALGAIVGLGTVGAVGIALSRIQRRRTSRYALLAGAIGLAVVFDRLVLTGNPDVDAVERVHFVEYGALAWLYARVWRDADGLSACVLTFSAGVLTGALDEWMQWFVPGRVGELRDVGLNAVALVCGLLFAFAYDDRDRAWSTTTGVTQSRIAVASALVLVALTAFAQTVHLGYLVDDGSLQFRSTFRRDALLAAQEDRRTRWSTGASAPIGRFAREDHYLEEGLWHVQRRNGATAANRFDVAWHENAILERYFDAVLTHPPSRSPTRWSDEQRRAVQMQAGDARPFSSDANPIPIYTMSPRTLWLCTLVAIAVIGAMRVATGMMAAVLFTCGGVASAMSMGRWLVIGGLLWFGARDAAAQTLTDGRLWWNVTVQERAGTTSPWRWYLEAQGRHREEGRAFDQLLLRPAVGYDVTSRSSVWAGIGYTPTYLASGDTLQELRAWQQYLWSGPALGGAFQSRTRLEQRDIEGNDGTAWRFREFIRHTTTVNTQHRLTAVVWDEVFLHANDTARTRSGFDQNRFFAGLGLPVGRQGRFEIGYLNQAVNGGRAADRMHHAVLGFLNLPY